MVKAIWPFVVAVLKHWWALLSCALFTVLGVYATKYQMPAQWIVSASYGVAIGCIFIAMFLAWFDVFKEVQAWEQRNRRPMVSLNYDSQKDTLVFENEGGDAFRVRLLFRDRSWIVDPVRTVPKVAAHTTAPIDVKVGRLADYPSGGVPTFTPAPSADSKIKQICEVIWKTEMEGTQQQTFMLKYEDEDAIDYESECELSYDGQNAKFSLLRAQRIKQSVQHHPRPYGWSS